MGFEKFDHEEIKAVAEELYKIYARIDEIAEGMKKTRIPFTAFLIKTARGQIDDLELWSKRMLDEYQTLRDRVGREDAGTMMEKVEAVWEKLRRKFNDKD